MKRNIQNFSLHNAFIILLHSFTKSDFIALRVRLMGFIIAIKAVATGENMLGADKSCSYPHPSPAPVFPSPVFVGKDQERELMRFDSHSSPHCNRLINKLNASLHILTLFLSTRSSGRVASNPRADTQDGSGSALDRIETLWTNKQPRSFLELNIIVKSIWSYKSPTFRLLLHFVIPCLTHAWPETQLENQYLLTRQWS